MDKKEVISKEKAYRLLLNDYFQLENVYLFGSYAKNTNREDSDIDVAIVVNHIEGDYFSVTPLLWKLRRQIDDRIEPKPAPRPLYCPPAYQAGKNRTYGAG